MTDRDRIEPALTAIIAANIEAGEEIGASFCAIQDGEIVADIRVGDADRKSQAPWTEETIACVYSSGKAALALMIARAVDDGLLDYDAPVADTWPDFAANGKEAITLGQVMSHQSGVCAFADAFPGEEWFDWDAICARVAACAPMFPPGSANGYSPQLYGFIAGEVLRRATGARFSAHLKRAGQDIFCGLTMSEMARAAAMTKPPRPPDLGALTEIKERAFIRPAAGAPRGDLDALMAAEIPASNCYANAAGLAGLLYPFADRGRTPDGGQFLSADAVREALRVRIEGEDRVLPFHLAWAAGVMANRNGHYGPSPPPTDNTASAARSSSSTPTDGCQWPM